ncbi:MAG: MlaD family protein [Planctomycetota bacterium]
MREHAQNFWIGLTSIVALGGLALLLFLFGELNAVFANTWTFALHVDDAAGLRAGSTVSMHGVRVGRIDSIEIDSTASRPVHLNVEIDEGISVPDNVQLFASSSLIGSQYTLVLALPDVPGPALPTDGNAVISGTIGSQLLDELTNELDRRMDPILERLAQFDQIAGAIVGLTDEVNDMVRPQTEEELADGTPANLRTATSRLANALESADDAFASAHEAFELSKKWLDDEQLRLDAREAVTKATTLIEAATETVDRYTKLADTIESDSESLVRGIVTVSDDLSATLEEVRRVTRIAADGDGTVGRLLREPDLYNALEDAAIRLERMMVEVQLLVEKLKAEGVRIGL